jgi:hypothetical protein
MVLVPHQKIHGRNGRMLSHERVNDLIWPPLLSILDVSRAVLEQDSLWGKRVDSFELFCRATGQDARTVRKGMSTRDPDSLFVSKGTFLFQMGHDRDSSERYRTILDAACEYFREEHRGRPNWLASDGGMGETESSHLSLPWKRLLDAIRHAFVAFSLRDIELKSLELREAVKLAMASLGRPPRPDRQHTDNLFAELECDKVLQDATRWLEESQNDFFAKQAVPPPAAIVQLLAISLIASACAHDKPDGAQDKVTSNWATECGYAFKALVFALNLWPAEPTLPDHGGGNGAPSSANDVAKRLTERGLGRHDLSPRYSRLETERNYMDLMSLLALLRICAQSSLYLACLGWLAWSWQRRHGPDAFHIVIALAAAVGLIELLRVWLAFNQTLLVTASLPVAWIITERWPRGMCSVGGSHSLVVLIVAATLSLVFFDWITSNTPISLPTDNSPIRSVAVFTGVAAWVLILLALQSRYMVRLRLGLESEWAVEFGQDHFHT